MLLQVQSEGEHPQSRAEVSQTTSLITAPPKGSTAPTGPGSIGSAIAGTGAGVLVATQSLEFLLNNTKAGMLIKPVI